MFFHNYVEWLPKIAQTNPAHLTTQWKVCIPLKVLALKWASRMCCYHYHYQPKFIVAAYQTNSSLMVTSSAHWSRATEEEATSTSGVHATSAQRKFILPLPLKHRTQASPNFCPCFYECRIASATPVAELVGSWCKIKRTALNRLGRSETQKRPVYVVLHLTSPSSV